jgi:TolB-like protein
VNLRPLFGLVASLVALSASGAEPRTLAVLPLQKATANAGPDGLGEALAGMLVSDLVEVPGLTLVERDRVDALLAEVALGSSGFLDPALAVRAGKGLGAQEVLVGSYAVVDQVLVIDARRVEVRTGRVTDAANARGPLSDFVALEKEIAEELIADLHIELTAADRRRLQSRALTEDLGAAQAWGAGLAARRAGRMDEARASFQRALLADPAFQQAQEALEGLGAALSASRTRAQVAIDARRALVLGALTSRAAQLPAPAPDEPLPDLADRILGWLAQTERGEDCAVRDATLAWLRVRNGAPAPREVLPLIHRRAQEAGYQHLPADLGGVKMAHDLPMRRAEAWTSPAGLLALSDIFDADEKDGWLAAALRCAEGAERPRAVAAVSKDAEELGLNAQEFRPWGTVGIALEAAWLWHHADQIGPSAEHTARAEALLRSLENDESRRVGTQVFLDRVNRRAREIALRRVRRAGASEADILAVARAIQSGGPPLTLGSDLCTTAVDFERSRSATLLGAYTSAVPGSEVQAFNLDMLADQRRVLSTLGCIQGYRASFRDLESGRAWALARLEQGLPADPAVCAGTMTQIRQQTSDTVLKQVASWPAGTPAWTWSIATFVISAESAGCIAAAPVR